MKHTVTTRKTLTAAKEQQHTFSQCSFVFASHTYTCTAPCFMIVSPHLNHTHPTHSSQGAFPNVLIQDTSITETNCFFLFYRGSWENERARRFCVPVLQQPIFELFFFHYDFVYNLCYFISQTPFCKHNSQ